MQMTSASQVQFLSDHVVENGVSMVPKRKIEMLFVVENRTTKAKQELAKQMEANGEIK